MENNWLKKNIGILSVLLMALIIRIYYFILVNGQTLWYDEAVYTNMAERFAFGIPYVFGPVRQVLFPFIISLFYRVSTSEFLPRVFILLCSMFAVYGIYLLGKEIFNKRVGLIASVLMAIFYLNLFFSYRLLVEIPSLTFFIFSAYFFYKYIKTRKKSSLYWFALMIGIGALFKLSTAFILVACFIFLLLTEGFKIFKRKEIYIASLIFILTLLPYIIFGYFEFGGFVLTQASSHVAPESYLNGFSLMLGYIKLFPTYFSIIFLVLFGMGLIYSLYKPFLYFNKLKEDNELKGYLYCLLLLVIPFILISFFVNHIENRYILTVFVSVIILGSASLNKIWEMVKDKSKEFATIIIIILLAFFFIHQIGLADSLIKNKQNSYSEIKEAGIWLKEYSTVYGQGILATKSQPQMRYYSGLDTINLPPTEEEFINWTKEFSPQYLMLSIFEIHPEWVYTYPERNNLTSIQAYITEEGQPLIVIYNLE